jgi:AcrR family transcriptional regulator
MGRKNIFTHKEAKYQAIELAEKIIIADGASALSVRKIATEIGCAVGTIYNMFESIDELVLHVNGRTLDTIHKEMKFTLEIYGMAEAYISFAHKNSHLWHALFEHKLKHEDLPKWYQKKVDNIFKLVENSTKQELHTHKNEASNAAKVIWAGVHGICSLSLNGTLISTRAGTPKALAESLIKNYVRGIQHG